MKMRLCKLISLLLCLLILSGCGNVAEEDPNAGKYICTEIVHEGMRLRPDELFSGEVSLKLFSGGKGSISLGAEGGSVKWSLEGEKLSIDINGEFSGGTLKDDVISLELYDSGTVLTLVKESALAEKSPGTDSQGLSGQWYGWWRISGAADGWAGYNAMWFDLCAEMEFNKDSQGRIKLWDEDYSREEPMALVHLELYEDGTAISKSGWFIGCEINQGDWILDKSTQDFDDLIVVKGRYEDDKGSFDYELMLRPWGKLWDDIEEENSEMLPYYYREWYQPLVEAGETMPGSIEADHGKGE